MDKTTTNTVTYCTVRWSNHNANLNQFLSIDYAGEKYTDVALACDGNILKAHKIILAGCSPLFETLFSSYGDGNPNLLIPFDGWGISYSTLQMILEFMYSGEIRVKKSELETLVKAGIKLKVKGLDAVKLSESKPPEVARPAISRPANLISASLKPTKLVKSPVPPAVRSPVTIPLPPVPVQKYSRKLVDSAAKKQKTAAAVSPTKGKIDLAKVFKTEPEASDEQEDDHSKTLEGKSAEDGVPTADEAAPAVSEASQDAPTPSVPSPKPNVPKSTRSTRKSRATRSTTEKKVPWALKRLKNDSDTASSPQSESSPAQTPNVSSPQKPTERASSAESDPAAQPKEGKEGSSQASKPPSDVKEREPDSEDPTSMEESPPEPNSTQPPADKNGEGESSSRSSRTIKKPARWADEDFIQEPPMAVVKKRRTAGPLSADGKDSPTVTEGEPVQAKKKKHNPFMVFCQDFKSKLQALFPDESRLDITRRLGLMWKHLDPAEKEKYLNPQENRENTPKK